MGEYHTNDNTPPLPHNSASKSTNADEPLHEQHFQEMNEANKRAKKLARASRIAGFNAWSAAIMAAFSLLFGIFSISSAIIGLALAYIAYQEFEGRKLLRQFQPKAADHLGYNQIIFSAMILAYAAWGMYEAFTAPVMSAQYTQYGPEMQSMFQPYDALYTYATIAVYAAIGLFGLIFQGGTAWYYFTRKKYIEKYLRETPDWIVKLQQQNPPF